MTCCSTETFAKAASISWFSERASEWIVDYIYCNPIEPFIVSNRDEFIHLMQQYSGSLIRAYHHHDGVYMHGYMHAVFVAIYDE